MVTEVVIDLYLAKCKHCSKWVTNDRYPPKKKKKGENETQAIGPFAYCVCFLYWHFFDALILTCFSMFSIPRKGMSCWHGILTSWEKGWEIPVKWSERPWQHAARGQGRTGPATVLDSICTQSKSMVLASSSAQPQYSIQQSFLPKNKDIPANKINTL